MDVFPYLKANPLLRGFTDDGIRIIQAAVTVRQLEPGMPIFVERMMGESLFLLAVGEVGLAVTRNGAEQEIGALYAPDSFGELSLVQPGPRRVSAKARTPALILEIARRDFQRLQQQRPQACLKLMVNVTETVAHKTFVAGHLIERLPELL
jgi:CRP/FNR family transcriptional regulator, cyclic AMP receptor protein